MNGPRYCLRPACPPQRKKVTHTVQEAGLCSMNHPECGEEVSFGYLLLHTFGMFMFALLKTQVDR
jgi:hypothetical protein